MTMNLSDIAAQVLNTTTLQESACLPYEDPVWSKALKGVAYIIIMALSLLGNSLTIYVIAKSRTMRSTTNFLIANKSVADLFITCVSMPICTMVNIQGFQKFTSLPLAMIVCKLNPVIHGTAMESAILSFMAIAFDRLFAITMPLRKVITTFKVKLIIAGIWAMSLLTLAPLLYVVKIEWTPNESRGIPNVSQGYYRCYERWPESFDQELAAKAYTVVLFLFFYGLPLSTMAIVYMIIIHRLCGRGKEILELLPMFVRRKQETNRKILKMLVTVVVTFAMCWLTFHIRMFMGFFGEVNQIPCALKPHLYFMAFSIAHSNSAITPMIYYFFNQSFRKNFKRVVLQLVPVLRCCCTKEENIGLATQSQDISPDIPLTSYEPGQRTRATNRSRLGVHRQRKAERASVTNSS